MSRWMRACSPPMRVHASPHKICPAFSITSPPHRQKPPRSPATLRSQGCVSPAGGSTQNWLRFAIPIQGQIGFVPQFCLRRCAERRGPDIGVVSPPRSRARLASFCIIGRAPKLASFRNHACVGMAPDAASKGRSVTSRSACWRTAGKPLARPPATAGTTRSC
jgi:hypothetical protein